MGRMSGLFWPGVSAALLTVLGLAFFIFERRRPSPEKMALLAVLSALSAVGRGLFAAIPSVQPSSFIIIMAGMTLGAEAGMLTGALTALLSGLWLGIGPWTPWQMLAWGLMGGLAGVLRRPLTRFKALRVGYGAAWGFLFGWLMNIWMLMSVSSPGMGWVYVLAVYAASLVFDGMHAAANAVLIFFGGDAFTRILHRVAVKYGLKEPIHENENGY